MKQQSFPADCDRCRERKACLTVVMKERRAGESFRTLTNLCAPCRKKTRHHWEWPTPTSRDAEHDRRCRIQEEIRDE